MHRRRVARAGGVRLSAVRNRLPEMGMRVNPIACDAHGMCAELFPERIALDDWGYPIIDDRPIPPELAEHARRAAAACPTLALLVRRQAEGLD
jgi:ferredoxin